MSNQNSLLQLSPETFITFLKQNKIKKFSFVYNPNTNEITASHNQLSEIAEFLTNDKRDFSKHEGLFFELDSEYDIIHSAAVHRTNRGQAAGGVRFWQYDTMEGFIRDGMRLAKGMTHKNALAGLWWGGGKGVIANNKAIDKNDSKVRKVIYSNFGKFITSLNGCYVTAEDFGTNVIDMSNIFTNTRFTTCIPNKLGGSGNPSAPTAQGVVSGIEAGLDFLNLGTIEDKTIAVQGLGNVAVPLIKFLFEKKASKIIGCDIFDKNVEEAKNKFKDYNFEAYKVDKDDVSILYKECDVLAPCATGAILNSETIPKIKAKVVCGASNNQLADPIEDDKLIFNSGILYVPDFLTNRMGIVNCANEQYGYIENDPNINQHYDKTWERSIHQTAMQVFIESKKQNKPTGKIALEIAEKLSLENHPIFGHRGEQIIKSLVQSNWANG
ncbi:MAG: Glu/Leu/Phe/Val dehydrogenase [Ignavibacteriae bacterium]|nr:Glu/Leu/Phe/Val dehydrogenase [Ignavibacteriota bacterium]